MRENKRKYEVRVDGYTRVCLTAIAVLLTVLIVGLWADYAPLASQTHAAGPFVETSTQAQLVEMVKAQNKTTAKLDQLIGVLKSGQVKVKILNADNKVAAAKGAANVSTPAKLK